MNFGEAYARVTALWETSVLSLWSIWTLFLSLVTSIEAGLAWFCDWVLKNTRGCYVVMWVSLGLGVTAFGIITLPLSSKDVIDIILARQLVHQVIPAKYALCGFVSLLLYGIVLTSILDFRRENANFEIRYPCIFLLAKAMAQVTALFGFLFLERYLFPKGNNHLIYVEVCLYFHLIAITILLNLGKGFDLVTSCFSVALAQKVIIDKMAWNQIYPFMIVSIIFVSLNNMLSEAAARTMKKTTQPLKSSTQQMINEQ